MQRSIIMLQDEFGNTALSCSCSRGEIEIAEKLVEKGANVNFMDKVRRYQSSITVSHIQGQNHI